ncbi:L,D-transpeptidase [Ahrensia marina]|uniref:ErfK/YbiS/YcfS/YnhG n=1 Tax=Ahrensia marina TaxID=1514904 RepID=A0A0N1J699_9HYPH|nr:L,D-transpeptidase [Ahrensia marina]KPB00054.1 ErfK/YbiS/YcfS/YnhG [Ahrensia marina]
MITRRFVLFSFAASTITLRPTGILAHKKEVELDPKYIPQLVRYSGYEAGNIVVDTKNHFLYLILKKGEALRYGVGVGRAGLKFKGKATVGRKAKWPRWTPTKNMIKREPQKYARFADGVPGGPANPLGSRALYLYQNGKDTLYRIHGTNQPATIGRSVSNGCIRMLNAHVEDLYERVSIGFQVIVV